MWSRRGDTLANVAKRFNVKPAALADENNLRASAAIKKGQKLRLPSGYKDKGPLKTTVTTTPAAPRPTTPRPATPTPSYTPPAATPPAALPSSPRPYTPSPSTSYPRTPTGPVSAQPVTPPPSSGQIIGSSPPPTEAEITAAGRGRFVWPLQGETISDFGAKGTGQRNDGVNIRAPPARRSAPPRRARWSMPATRCPASATWCWSSTPTAG
jgi:murein DD-endopeptidase MepM/ murein hydrolase activator NlpD